jgi:hypothetical protein
MKKLYRNAAEKQRAYLERKRQNKEIAAESLSEEALCAKFDLRFFGESRYGHNAESSQEEIHIHRQFLRGLGGEPDVQPGETLRQLAKRTWDALLLYEFTSVDGDTVWIPMFNAKTQDFDGGPNYEGYRIRHAMKPDWFETHWTAPKDCTGDEAIDRRNLPVLPPGDDFGFLSNLAGRVIKPRRINTHPSWTT